MPIQGFADPFIVASFIDDDHIFVALFYNYDLTHYHFIYEQSTNSIQGNKVYNMKMKGTKMNFPYKSFYNEIDKVIHLFYRQG